MKKHAGKIVVIAVALMAVILGAVFGLKGCGGTGAGSTSASGNIPDSSISSVGSSVVETEKTNYTVELKSAGGMALADVGIFVYTDSTKSELVWFDQTDEFGMMTFNDVVSNSYVAVLEGVPVGYAVEDCYPLAGEVTTITLSGALTPYEEAGEITYELGSMLYDFTVTTPDGTEYTLSSLLQEKKLVVLNFWYTTCEPCKKEFPVIQTVSEQYSEDAIVLAMNPVDGENDKITAIMEELELNLPMAGCGSEWAKMLGITAYPTTVVIDRYGMISMMHTGSVTNPEVWEVLFGHYTSDDYVQATYDNISILAEGMELEGELEQGSEDNPIEVGSADSLTVDVASGGVTYLTIYKMNHVYLSIKDPDAYIIYNGKTYNASNGRVTVWLSTDDTFSGMEVGIGNSGSEDKTFTLTFAAKAGSIGNPYKLALGEFTTNYDAGNEQGIYYTWVATESGVLTLENVSCSAPSGYSYVLYNLSSYKQNVSENESISIEVMAGQTVQVIVGVKPVDGFSYPAATIVSKATFESGEVDTKSYPFVVTVVDEEGKVIPGVALSADSVDVATDELGAAAFSMKKGEHHVYITVPSGYQELSGGIAVEVTGEEDADQLTITLKKIRKYVVTVTDQGGFAVPGAVVTVGEAQVTTDVNGVAEFRMVSGEYFADVTAPYGYTSVTGAAFDAELAAAVQLEAALVPYAVRVTDTAGTPVAGAVVTIPEQTSALASGADVIIPAIKVTTDAEGIAVYETYLAGHELTVSCEGYFADGYSVAAGEQTRNIAIHETAAYTVYVTSTAGETVEGVTVFVSESTGLTDAVLTGTSDENGMITILAPKGGSYTARVDVAALPDGYAFDSSELTFSEDGTLSITLMSDRIFAVQVLDQTGAPVRGAEVTFHGLRIENQEAVEGEESILVETPVDYVAATNSDGIAYFVASAAVSAEITVPNGYRLGDGEVQSKAFGEATQLTFALQSVTTYSVTLNDYAGNLFAGEGMSIQLVNGEQSWNADFMNGVAAVSLDSAEYAVSIIYDSAKYHIESGSLTLTPGKTGATVRVAALFNGTVDPEAYYGVLRYVDLGSTYLELTPGAVNYVALELGENDASGYYSFRFYGDAEVYSHGGIWFDTGADRDKTDAEGVCTLNIYSNGNVLVGLHADEDATGGVLQVTYVGEKVEIPVRQYDDPDYTPARVTLPMGTLTTFAADVLLNNTFVNPLYGVSDAFVEENGCLYYVADGVRHQLFINLSWNTMSIANLLANGPFNAYLDTDGDGEYDLKEEYTNNLQSYVDNAANGYYPLNMELLYMLCHGGDHQGWWDPASPTNSYNDYFSTLSSPDNAWMTFLAYLN